MMRGAQLCHFFGLPAVHEPRIKHHDGHENQQRALCGHPKINRPPIDFHGQIACKKTRPKTGQKPNRQQGPLQTVLTFFQRGRWRVNFRHAQGYAKKPWRLYAQRHTPIRCLPLHAQVLHDKHRRAPKVSKQARGVALCPDILLRLNHRKRVAQMIAFEIRQFLQMQVVVRLQTAL